MLLFESLVADHGTVIVCKQCPFVFENELVYMHWANIPLSKWWHSLLRDLKLWNDQKLQTVFFFSPLLLYAVDIAVFDTSRLFTPDKNLSRKHSIAVVKLELQFIAQ